MRSIAITVALIGCATTVLLHLLTLSLGQHDAVSEPIARLGTGAGSDVHALGLLSFTLAHLALAYILYRPDAGRLYRAGIGLIVVAGLLLLALVPGLIGSDSASTGVLWLVASVVGVAMGLMVPRLWRTHRTAAWFDLACLVAWVVLAPAFVLVPPDMLGAYERSVAVLYTAWLAGLALLLYRRSATSLVPPPRAQNR